VTGRHRRRGELDRLAAQFTAGPTVNIEHAGGQAWNETAPPRRWHRCRRQTWGTHPADCQVSDGTTNTPVAIQIPIARCRCGAVAVDDAGWALRNSR
jgi:hypothetical protein